MSRFVQSRQINANEEQTGAKNLSKKKKKKTGNIKGFGEKPLALRRPRENEMGLWRVKKIWLQMAERNIT